MLVFKKEINGELYWKWREYYKEHKKHIPISDARTMARLNGTHNIQVPI